MLGRCVPPLLLLGIFTVPGVAQTEGASPAPGAPVPTAPTANPPGAKKVWTNDDLPTAGKGSASPADKRKQTDRSDLTGGDPLAAERIRKNLEKLEGQIHEIDKKLKTFKEFLAGEPVSSGARDLSKGINRVPVDQQIAQLGEKRKQLEAQIGELYDEARKKGIDPGQLR